MVKYGTYKNRSTKKIVMMIQHILTLQSYWDGFSLCYCYRNLDLEVDYVSNSYCVYRRGACLCKGTLSYLPVLLKKYNLLY